MRRKDYLGEARLDAAEMALEFLDEITENMLDTQGTSLHYADYTGGDEYHHQTHIDRDWSLTEAAEIIEQCRWNLEDDSGLWQGLEPIKAVIAQAAYTYGNTVTSFFQDLIHDLNKDSELDKLLNPEPVEDDDPEVDSEAVKARIKEAIEAFR